MRDIDRIDRIIGKLRGLWKTYPDLRFGQMIYNILYQIAMNPDKMHALEDDAFEKLIDEEIQLHLNKKI